ncbi:hypothetical protein M3J09_005231 [Ascochyta lentis]
MADLAVHDTMMGDTQVGE